MSDMRRAAFTLGIASALLGACSGPVAIAFFEEVTWYGYGLPDAQLRREVELAAASAGVQLQAVVDTGSQPRAALSAALEAHRADLAVLFPLLSLEAEAIASAHPSVHFVAIGGLEPTAANLTSVQFDSDRALENAGRVMALYVAARPGTRVAVIERPLAGSGGAEHVVAGVLDEAGPTLLLRRELQAGADRVRLRRLIEGVVRDGAVVVFLDVGDLAAVALATIADQGALAAVRNWGRRPGYKRVLLLSVDEVLSDGLRAGLEGAAARADGRGPPPGTISVPARLVWRIDEEPPPAAAALVDEKVPSGTPPPPIDAR